MIVGFNHNITYRGVGFHVQTEDSGVQRPQLVTLLYHGGTIISSQKTVYADIIKVDNLDQVVEELAKEQHKGMLKKLTHGEFDSKINALGISLGAAVSQTQASPITTSAEKKNKNRSEMEETVEIAPEPVEIVEEPVIDKFNQTRATRAASLDDQIFAYLTAGQKR